MKQYKQSDNSWRLLAFFYHHKNINSKFTTTDIGFIFNYNKHKTWFELNNLRKKELILKQKSYPDLWFAIQDQEKQKQIRKEFSKYLENWLKLLDGKYV